MQYRLARALVLLAVGVTGALADVVDVQPLESYSTTRDAPGWEPGSKVYRLVNTSSDWVYWQARSVEGLAVCQPHAGWIVPSGFTSLEVAPAPFMGIAPPGVYTEEVSLDFSPRQVGDLDGDGKVDVADLFRMVTAFGRNDRTCDFDSSGLVDILDLMRLVQNFGQSASSLDI